MVRTKRRIELIAVIKADIAKDITYDVNFNGWTQNEVAALTGLSQGDVSLILGQKNLSKFTIDRLLMVLIIFGHKPTFSVL